MISFVILNAIGKPKVGSRAFRRRGDSGLGFGFGILSRRPRVVCLTLVVLD